MSNSTHNMSEKLVLYLDGVLPENEKAELEKQLATDTVLQEELDNLKLAKEAVRNYGLKQEVSGIHQQMMTEMQTPLRQIGSSRRIIRYTMSVAAGLLVIFAGITAYNYFTISGEKVFKENFRLYELATVRDYTWVPTIEKAYKEEDFRMVTALADTSSNPKYIFLSSVAYLQLNDPVEAIKGFQKILSMDKETGSASFKEESEYYLGLACILDKQYDKALQILQPIKDNPDHLYHEKVTGKLIRKVNRLR
ncbi:MAG: hypothetical protein JNK14_12510 [Chitinophagaceae bacterium]|nr:hypothetical protein [Chitinophagaceae bacterium]